MFWKKKKPVSALEKTVSDLASFLLENGVNEQFRNLAIEKASGLELSSCQELKTMFHNPPKEAAAYNVEKHGLGGWLSACQFSIFELIYNIGEGALPFIREIAWDKYDWTQGNAIELLVRFAAKGIQRNEIINEIKENYPNIRYEAQLYAIQPLLPRLASDSALQSVFDELLVVEAFKESYDELIEDNAK
jgi:hypothetical protein